VSRSKRREGTGPTAADRRTRNASKGLTVQDVVLPLELAGLSMSVCCLQPKNLLLADNTVEASDQKSELLRRVLAPILRHDRSHKNSSLEVIVIPEVSTPKSLVPGLIELMRDVRVPTILVAGVEHMSCNEYVALAKSIKGKHAEPQWAEASSEDRTNPALIVASQPGTKPVAYLQPKLSPSKFEAGVMEEDTIVAGDHIYRFSLRAGGFSFMVLTCSDIFSRLAGHTVKPIDDVGWRLANDEPLDMIINLQHTTDNDHPLFVRSLQELFKDGYGRREDLIVVESNAVLPGTGGLEEGGKSKLLLWHEKPIQQTRAVRGTRAPVTGYEMPLGECVVRFRFDRLPAKGTSARTTGRFITSASTHTVPRLSTTRGAKHTR
jgi:hypothetical protein